jgi:hypothetical protein
LGLVLLVACDAGVPAKPPPTPPPPIAHEYADCPEHEFAEHGERLYGHPGAYIDLPEVLATLRRHACYGTCPVYQVVVYRDGRVEYNGTKWVAECAATGYLQPLQLGVLEQMLRDVVAMKDAYLDEDWTDASTVDLAYSPQPGKRKSIQHYHGDEDAPQRLEMVETAFDMIVGTERWVRVDPRE